ncbi:expressed unknown protein [Seminavis robusta]|uniref:CENP-V/GFA domain-containing protein n=1 Tax=Seminavis robusta TaxID=568900 RepID=A0A9N8E5C2_9STRA|nr:expressed unknown protein [Seminavis robusta]|eukprot:Sro676_g185661.1  (159) ;mRNA; f:27157-27633
MMEGSCLCKAVTFRVDAHVSRLYQCHCSLCQKQSGSTSNTATIVKASDFRWLAGEDSITKWQRETGFSSHFCKTCGCPVPNPLRNTPYYWIPMGLIDANTDDSSLEKGAQVRVHLFCKSKASWDTIQPHTERMYDEFVDNIDSFIQDLMQLKELPQQI